MGQIKQGDSGATVTREQWILPLLRTLGFEGITFSPSAAQVGGETYFISHPLGEGVEGLPIHIEGARNNLDRRLCPLEGHASPPMPLYRIISTGQNISGAS